MKRVLEGIMMVAFFLFALAGQGLANEADEKAIHATAQAYVDAFNAGNVDAILDLWSDNGDYVDPTGKAFKGKDAIGEELADFFSQNEGVTMEIVIDTIHFDSPTLAIEDGVTETWQEPKGSPNRTRYTVVHVKEDGKWLMQSVREGIAYAPSNQEQLEGLEWMIGDWVDQEEGHTVQSSCDWSVNKNFLIRTFISTFEGSNRTMGTQTIGWDPGTGSIKSWTFDTNGGITEGVWSKEGDKWLCKISTVLRGGEKLTSTEVLTVVDDDTHTWQSVDRKIDDESLPDTEVVTIKRQS